VTRIEQTVKRGFDVCSALVGFVVLSLPAIAIALLVKITSPGPVFYRQARVGQHGKLFNCVKFRTMRSGSERLGSVTIAADTRVTPLGRWLRRKKLDEMPQLWNVLRGQMSLVGPRPDVPGFADSLQGEDRLVLSLKPGITGPATLRFRDEEGLLGQQRDPERYNLEVIFPEKVRINREYVQNYSFWKDIMYIWLTLVPPRRR
jgi:lipopolysaccharide/colanic/teichoic acid biosynthesis glycosyltransferase